MRSSVRKNRISGPVSFFFSTTPGLADLLVLAPELPVGFIELKRDDDSPISDPQRDFGSLCMQLGIPYAICVGRDEPITMLEAWAPCGGPPHEQRGRRRQPSLWRAE
jgi:hypothetical protein